MLLFTWRPVRSLVRTLAERRPLLASSNNVTATNMPCPFLAKLSSTYVHNYAPELLKVYGRYCPIVSRAFETRASGSTDASTSLSQDQRNKVVTACPFLAGTQVSEVVDPEIVGESTFPYDSHFREKIVAKKMDHSYRVFRKINRLAGHAPNAVEYSFGEKPVTVWCSNDYLGMSGHPQVMKAVSWALEKFGCGSGGTRNISGNSVLHEKLEQTIAQLHQKEAGLVFTSCFVANDSTLCTLAKALPGCHIFSDAGNHASMIQGIRNSGVPKHIFRHNDPRHLEEQLRKVDKAVPKIVAFETVHSMTGAVCPLEDLCDVTHRYGGLTYIDEVHAVGLYGKHGAGIGERDGVLDKMDVISGTFGKAFGNIGGYIVSTAILVDMIRSYAPGFIFTTSLPPVVLAGTLKAIEILSSEEGRELRRRHQDNVKYLRDTLVSLGFPVEHTPSHIIPIKIGDPRQVTLISQQLSQRGHYIQAINYPTVARGQEKLRLAPTPYHTKQHIDLLIKEMLDVWKELNLPLPGLQCAKQCQFCQKPITFKYYEARAHDTSSEIVMCDIPNCPMVAAA